MDGLVVLVPLTNGGFATVDGPDAKIVARHKWMSRLSDFGAGDVRYAVANIAGQHVLMHRLILSAPSHLVVNHRDFDGLHNCRCNIELCTRAQNTQYMRKQTKRKTASGFKGVNWNKHRGAWAAQIWSGGEHGKNRHLGYFANEADAARAYDRAARELFGEFARLNFPENQ